MAWGASHGCLPWPGLPPAPRPGLLYPLLSPRTSSAHTVSLLGSPLAHATQQPLSLPTCPTAPLSLSRPSGASLSRPSISPSNYLVCVSEGSVRPGHLAPAHSHALSQSTPGAGSPPPNTQAGWAARITPHTHLAAVVTEAQRRGEARWPRHGDALKKAGLYLRSLSKARNPVQPPSASPTPDTGRKDPAGPVAWALGSPLRPYVPRSL